MKEMPNPPKRVWVYWCKRCGAPILADERRDCALDCPQCPYPQNKSIAVSRYELVHTVGAK